ncbi:MAG: site-2 protease family protein [Chloroflexota bacterium]
MNDLSQNGSSPNLFLDGALASRLRAAIEDVFTVIEVDIPKEQAKGTIIFRGDLKYDDSEIAYELLAERWLSLDYTPMLRRSGTSTMVELIANPGTIHPKPSDPRINVILFIITVISMLVIGAMNEGVNPFENPGGITAGLPFALSFLAILGAHEFGHYFVARYHKVAVTLPYFIPFPISLWGTLGAFIQLRSPPKTKKALFDVGVAGPIAGLVVAIPVLIIGLMLSEVEPLPPEGGYLMEGNSILYRSIKFLIFGQVLPNGEIDVFLHPLAWAGWSGLLVTVLNLLPVGQLDGGHITYVLFDRYTRPLGFAMIGIMLILGLILWEGWLLWALITFLLVGTGHPPPLNDLVPLGNRRRLLAIAMIIVFVLLFTPSPITIVEAVAQ